MSKFFVRFLGLIFIIFISGVIFLSYFGLETNKFNNLIQNKANEVNQNIKLKFQKSKIHLNLTELNLVVKLKEPIILVKGSEINLSKLDLYLSIKSFFTSKFLLKRSDVAFTKNDIKDITKITNIFLPRIINAKLKKVLAKGDLEGEFFIPFEENGKIGKDFHFHGKVSNALINFTKDFLVKNLTAEIDYRKGIKTNEFTATIKNASLFDLKLADSNINLRKGENKTTIRSSIAASGKLNFSQIKKIASLFELNTDNFKNIDGIVNLKTNINFDLDRKFKIKNLVYKIEGKANSFDIDIKEKKIVKKYLPEFNSKINFENTDIKFFKSKSKQTAEFDGLIKTDDHLNSFEIKERYNYEDKIFDINGSLDLTNYQVHISKLNYKKDKKKESKVNFDISFISSKYYYIRNFDFISGKNKIYISDLKLNSNLETDDLKRVEIKTFLNEIKNNDFVVDKSDKIIIRGEIFDAQPLLRSLYKKDKGKTFSKNFDGDIKINFNKMLTGTNDNLSNFGMVASVKKGSYDKLNLKGNFSKNEIVEMSIYQVDKDKKTVQIISDRARPFMKSFNFIKGFEGGKLEYESIITKDDSNSNLIITDFKVSKVPALAKLLTLASLQGIADTLSGEGIRFESFEMKSNSKGNLLNIEDALAIGPAVSILLDGYVDKGKIVSLRGTLVPATKLNSIIASIPIVGDILVGKKTGEGVVGVSFKMKGPPKDIKTTVNPIKTLTPRFIVRAIEKMKKKEEPK